MYSSVLYLLLVPDPAAAFFTQFKPGRGHSAGQRRVHRLWGHPQRWESASRGYKHQSEYSSWCLFCRLADPAQSELMGDPHLMVEYKLGLLWRKETLMQDWFWSVALVRNAGAGGWFSGIQTDIHCSCMSSVLGSISNKYFWFCLKFPVIGIFVCKSPTMKAVSADTSLLPELPTRWFPVRTWNCAPGKVSD